MANCSTNIADSLIQNLHPYVSGSYSRLDNIAHHLGVTDRYVGYRHNLNRGRNQPVNVHTTGIDQSLPQTSITDWKDWTHAFQRDITSFCLYEKVNILYLDYNSSSNIIQPSLNHSQKRFDHIKTTQPKG